jgi:hypothetical protein
VSNLSADLLQMLVHGRGVGVGHDQSRVDSALRADRAEDIGGDMPVVADHQGPRAHRSPNVGVRALLPDPRFILEPYCYWAASLGADERRFGQTGETFLKTASASASFLG